MEGPFNASVKGYEPVWVHHECAVWSPKVGAAGCCVPCAVSRAVLCAVRVMSYANNTPHCTSSMRQISMDVLYRLRSVGPEVCVCGTQATGRVGACCGCVETACRDVPRATAVLHTSRQPTNHHPNVNRCGARATCAAACAAAAERRWAAACPRAPSASTCRARYSRAAGVCVGVFGGGGG
jgi:hypothetical protein